MKKQKTEQGIKNYAINGTYLGCLVGCAISTIPVAIGAYINATAQNPEYAQNALELGCHLGVYSSIPSVLLGSVIGGISGLRVGRRKYSELEDEVSIWEDIERLAKFSENDSAKCNTPW